MTDHATVSYKVILFNTASEHEEAQELRLTEDDGVECSNTSHDDTTEYKERSQNISLLN